MKRFIFTGIIILFVMAGCGGDHSSTDGLITVDVNDSYSTKKELVLQDFMDVEYIPLETNDEFINRACVQAVGEKYFRIWAERKSYSQNKSQGTRWRRIRVYEIGFVR